MQTDGSCSPVSSQLLAGSSGAGCACCLKSKDVTYSISEVSDLNHIVFAGRSPFTLVFSFPGKEEKTLLSHSTLNLGHSGAKKIKMDY